MKKGGVYRIVNTITGDYYIGSSNDLDRRKREHFCKSSWRHQSNKQLYKDMEQYGKDNFLFEPIWLCNPEELKKYEQIAIEKYNPYYNICAAYTGLTREQYSKKYYEENATVIKQKQKQYREQKCLYEGEILSLSTLRQRFASRGIQHPTIEAKKYLI